MEKASSENKIGTKIESSDNLKNKETIEELNNKIGEYQKSIKLRDIEKELLINLFKGKNYEIKYINAMKYSKDPLLIDKMIEQRQKEKKIFTEK